MYALGHHLGFIKRFEIFFSFEIPRFPLPKKWSTYAQMVRYGRQLRALHLLEDDTHERISLKNRERVVLSKSHEITRITVREKNDTTVQIWINTAEFFDDIPKEVATFYVGGYQPAQQWLKERKGRILSSKELSTYARIISILTRTKKLMTEILQIDILGD